MDLNTKYMFAKLSITKGAGAKEALSAAIWKVDKKIRIVGWKIMGRVTVAYEGLQGHFFVELSQVGKINQDGQIDSLHQYLYDRYATRDTTIIPDIPTTTIDKERVVMLPSGSFISVEKDNYVYLNLAGSNLGTIDFEIEGEVLIFYY